MRIRRLPFLFALPLALLSGPTEKIDACGPDLAWPMLSEESLLTSVPIRPFLDGLKSLDDLPQPEVERQDSGDAIEAVLKSDLDALRRWIEKRGDTSHDSLEDQLRVTRSAIRDHQKAMQEWVDYGAWGDPPVFEGVAIPAGLPDELRLYLEGAVAYHRRDAQGAARAWRSLLELPEEERRERTVTAHFMLGRLAPATRNPAATPDSTGASPDEASPGMEPASASEPSLDAERFEVAIHHLQETRRLASSGWRDDLGLAFESIGWEARRELDRGRFTEAIRLYAEQLAGGDPSAAISLKWTCAALLRAEPKHLEDAAADPMSREIFSLYLAEKNHLGEPAGRWLEAVERHVEGFDIDGPKSTEAATGSSTLAWVAYQQGQFDVAERWLHVTDANDPFTPWLQSKLAARAGDLEASQAHLEEASRRLGAQAYLPRIKRSRHDYMEWVAAERALAEAGAVELERGDFQSSLEDLLTSGYWMDASYLAERVLTLDELKDHVEAKWPADRKMKTPADSVLWGYGDPGDDGPASQIRYLLARRLAREGRWQEAKSFYPNAALSRAAEEIAKRRGRAERSDLPAKTRAAELWSLAKLIRDQGLELMGTELDPDWHLWGAVFDIGSFPRAGGKEEELERARKALPEPRRRYHYRYVAAELGWRAAELMPDESDDTANVLFVAGTWMKYLDPERADRFYKALVRRCGQTELGREAERRRWFPPSPSRPWF